MHNKCMGLYGNLSARLSLYWVDLGTAFWTRLNSSSAVFACWKRDNVISHEEWPNWDQGMYMCCALNNDGPQGLVTLLKYLTTKASNYWKTIAKQVIYIPFTMPKSVRIFSLSLVNNARLRSNFKHSCFVFHRGFQTLENNKSTRPTASCFRQFSRVWKRRWNTRTRFWNITSTAFKTRKRKIIKTFKIKNRQKTSMSATQ